MNSPVLGGGKDDFFTRNTRGDADEDDPERHLLLARPRDERRRRELEVDRAALVHGSSGTCSRRIQTPGSGDALTFPANPVVLNWSGIPGAAALPRLGRQRPDPRLARLPLRQPGRPEGPAERRRHVGGDHRRRSRPGSYYWSVTPVDAEGNRGVPTPVASFNWLWPTVTTTQRRRPERDARGLRPALLVGRGPRRRALRGRDQLLGRLRARLEGLLRRHDASRPPSRRRRS